MQASKEANAVKERLWDEAKEHGTAADQLADEKLGRVEAELDSKLQNVESSGGQQVIFCLDTLKMAELDSKLQTVESSGAEQVTCCRDTLN